MWGLGAEQPLSEKVKTERRPALTLHPPDGNLDQAFREQESRVSFEHE